MWYSHVWGADGVSSVTGIFVWITTRPSNCYKVINHVLVFRSDSIQAYNPWNHLKINNDPWNQICAFQIRLRHVTLPSSVPVWWTQGQESGGMVAGGQQVAPGEPLQGYILMGWLATSVSTSFRQRYVLDKKPVLKIFSWISRSMSSKKLSQLLSTWKRKKGK